MSTDDSDMRCMNGTSLGISGRQVGVLSRSVVPSSTVLKVEKEIIFFFSFQNALHTGKVFFWVDAGSRILVE